jgi:hypothetical protein
MVVRNRNAAPGRTERAMSPRKRKATSEPVPRIGDPETFAYTLKRCDASDQAQRQDVSSALDYCRPWKGQARCPPARIFPARGADLRGDNLPASTL